MDITHTHMRKVSWLWLRLDPNHKLQHPQRQRQRLPNPNPNLNLHPLPPPPPLILLQQPQHPPSPQSNSASTIPTQTTRPKHPPISTPPHYPAQHLNTLCVRGVLPSAGTRACAAILVFDSEDSRTVNSAGGGECERERQS
ncbi:hypothetical protein M422DRAFT_256565 [Sphaerobolus stellatus SS14]|uniref:Uncharacterized protein n=1 Tax=Sphaerobolus stellatus (strain SS14) TaxID=990650 RepID=A0A0C9V0F7_SPHS4|nr:hypothetical protein M422DRAFT_256565 [Sphaerobolus stellatus SS14]